MIISFTMLMFNLLPYYPLDGYQMLKFGANYLFGHHKDNQPFRNILFTIVHLLSAIIIVLYLCLFFIKLKHYF